MMMRMKQQQSIQKYTRLSHLLLSSGSNNKNVSQLIRRLPLFQQQQQQQSQNHSKRYMVTIPRNPDIYDDLYPNPDATNDPFPPPMRNTTSSNNNKKDTTTTTTTKTSSSSGNNKKDNDLKTKKKSIKQEVAEELENEYKDIYNKKTRIFIKLCYTDHDIEEGDIVKSYFHYDDILETAEEEFGVEIDGNPKKNYKLEYYNGEDWIKLVPYRLYEVLQFFPCTSIKPLPIRVPALYDEEYGTRNDVVKLKKVTPDMRKKQMEYIKSGPSPQQWLMKEMIDAIVKRLKMEGYVRSSNSTLEQPVLQFQFHDPTDGTIKSMDQSTKEYVLDLARSCPWSIPTIQEEAEMERQQLKEQGIERPGSKANPIGAHPNMMKNRNTNNNTKKKSTPPTGEEAEGEGGEGEGEGDGDGKNTAIEPENDPNKIIKKLKHVLLSQPRALQHIVECLHYDYVWEN
jgi:hypothetical protein